MGDQALSQHELIRKVAEEVGLDLLGVTSPQGSAVAQQRFDAWIASERHGEMRYLERHAPAKTDATAVLPGCAAVIVVGLSYNRRPRFGSHPQVLDAVAHAGTGEAAGRSLTSKGRVAMYAWGRDYHRVLRRKLRDLIRALAEAVPGERFAWSADTTPLLETHFAARAGLGFQGKHTLLIHRRLGSWFVIGEVLTTVPLCDGPPAAMAARPAERGGPRCGTSCNHCRDVCPTGALDDEWRIDARRCISYLTIEHQGSIPLELRPLIGDWLFGCDLCQEVCPWNVRAEPTAEKDFITDRAGPTIDLGEVLAIKDHDELAARFAGTPLMRAGRRGLVRNACVVAANVQAHHLLGALQALTADADTVVAEHARWACERLAADRPSGGVPA